MPLADLPPELLLLITQRISPSAVCRLRQTCRAVDSSLESKRYNLRSHSTNENWILRIQVEGITKPKLRVSVLSVPKNKPKWYNGSDSGLRLTQDVSKKAKISNAFEQLSGFQFHGVIVKFNFRGGNWKESEETCRERQNIYFFEELVPLIESLGLECETLCLENVWPEKVCPLIRFNRLFTYRIPVLVKDYKKWPVWHCVEHEIQGLNLDGDLNDPTREGWTIDPSTLAHIQNATFHFTMESRVDGPSSLEEFLVGVSKDRTKTGKLEFLRLHYADICEDFDFLKKAVRAERLYMGHPFKYEYIHTYTHTHNSKFQYNWTSIVKIEIDCGMALNVMKSGFNNVYFFDDYNRSVLLDTIVPWLFPDVPWDLSVIYEDFIWAPDDKTAVAGLCEHYATVRVQWMFENRRRPMVYTIGLPQFSMNWHDSDNEDDETEGKYYQHPYVVLKQ